MAISRSQLAIPFAFVVCALCLACGAAKLCRAGETGPLPEVPPGFTIEVVAGPPLIHHPLMACFDDLGRLYVTDAAGVNLDEKELGDQLPNGIRRLEDTDGDGRFDRSTVFADRMTFPNGGVWRGDSLYVVSPPYVWRLTDRDGDGVAEERTELVGKFGFVGNAADLHGCFIGPEGRLWWCDGRHGHEFRDAQGNVVSQGEAARIFSCNLDGTDVRWHCGGGMDNPVEIDFTPTGNVLGTVNLFYQKRGDCLVDWQHGGRYPRDDQSQAVAEFRRTGDLLGPVLNYGHVAVSGTVRYRGEAYGETYRHGHFVCEFNTHQVNFTTIAPEGSTYRAERQDFLRSSSIDFHPTDVLEDADGSLLVIDTGGWFRYGCPTSQVAKPEITGAIYRIRRTGAVRAADPRGQEIDWAKQSPTALVTLLADGRWEVAEHAKRELVARGEKSIEALTESLGQGDPSVRLAALWTLHQVPGEAARSTVREQLSSDDPLLRQVAARAAGWSADADAIAVLLDRLRDPDAGVRRAAAEALGRCRAADATPALLTAIPAAIDREEEHALIYAALEIADADDLVQGLRHEQPWAQRAALIVLDQIAPQRVAREDVLRLLGSAEPLTQREALDVIARRPEWNDALTDYWRESLAKPLDEANSQWLRGAIAAVSDQPPTQALIAELLANPTTSADAKSLLLSVVESSNVAPLPDGWIQALEQGCHEGNEALRRQFLRVAASARDERLGTSLDDIAHSAKGAEQAFAIAGLAELGRELSAAQWRTLLDAWGHASDARDRTTFVGAITRAKATPAQRAELAAGLNFAEPLDLASVLPAFRSSPDLRVGEALLAALEKHPGLAVTPYADLRATFAEYPAETIAKLEALLASREVVTADQQARLAAFNARDGQGAAERGKALFFASKAACSACHRIGDQGAAIGPDLSQIGKIRTRSDFGESILYPSLSLARGYDTLRSIATTDGHTFGGLVERETADAIYLRTPQRELVRIPRDQIEEQAPSRTSIMPQGFGDLLTPAELDDVVAYLLSLK